jgi:transposase-like protein
VPLSRIDAPSAASDGDIEAPGGIMPVTNLLERLNAEIKRRTNVVGIFPNDASITRLVGAMMLEQNDERSFNPRLQTLAILFSLGCPLWPAE